MIRETKQNAYTQPWLALALIAAVAGCGSAGTTGEGNPGGSTPSMGSGNTNDTAGSSGSASASGKSKSSPGKAPPSTTAAPAGTGTPGADNNTFISIPADDLAPPDPAEGFQFVTPPGAFTVQPNQEIFPNYCVVVPKDISVGGFRSWMTPNSSHHFILYMNAGTSSSPPTGGACNMSFAGGVPQWVYATSTPGAITGMNMPANVGLDMAANTVLDINMHFINPGTTAAQPQIKINVLFAKNVMYKASTMISFNTGINVPAADSNGPGTQTVTGKCTAPVGANIFMMSTHTHKHATAAWINYLHNGGTTEVVHTGSATTYPADQEKGSGTDWEHPGIGSWASAPFLTVQQGDSFTYSCSYSNTASTRVTVGETAASNEMCMAIAYWFPASLGRASCY